MRIKNKREGFTTTKSAGMWASHDLGRFQAGDWRVPMNVTRNCFFYRHYVASTPCTDAPSPNASFINNNAAPLRSHGVTVHVIMKVSILCQAKLG